MKSDWTQSTLEDLCVLITDGAHNSPASVTDGEYMVSVKDFTEFGFDFSNCKKISKQDYAILEKQNCVPQKDDILIGKDGARYFEDIIIYRQSERPALLSSIAILRADTSKITPEYLFYTLKSPSVKKDVRENYGSGSAIPRIVIKDFKRMTISFPKLEKQGKIVSTLKALDDKIALNQQINKDLEEQAQAIYNDLFANVLFDAVLSDLGTIVGGSTPSKKHPEYYAEQGIAWITPKDLSNDSSKFIYHGENDITELGLSKCSASIMPTGTVLFSSRAPIGYIAIAANPVSTNQGFKSVIPNKDIGTAFIYCFLRKRRTTLKTEPATIHKKSWITFS